MKEEVIKQIEDELEKLQFVEDPYNKLINFVEFLGKKYYHNGLMQVIDPAEDKIYWSSFREELYNDIIVKSPFLMKKVINFLQKLFARDHIDVPACVMFKLLGYVSEWYLRGYDLEDISDLIRIFIENYDRYKEDYIYYFRTSRKVLILLELAREKGMDVEKIQEKIKEILNSDCGNKWVSIELNEIRKKRKFRKEKKINYLD